MVYLIQGTEAGQPEEQPLVLQTRLRRSIPNEVRLEWSAERLKAAIDMFNGRPNIKLRSITATYNCVGMVVAHRRTFVDIDDLHAVLHDDGFRRLTKPEETEIGDLVVYHYNGEPTHVGVISEKVPSFSSGASGDCRKVLSKWGTHGEYWHGLTDVPHSYGAPSEYWTDRKEIRS